MNGDEDVIQLSKDELDTLLISAAKKGAQEALERIGLGDEKAAGDVRDFRSIMESFRLIRRTAIKTAVGRIVDYGIMLLILALAAKFGAKFLPLNPSQ